MRIPPKNKHYLLLLFLLLLGASCNNTSSDALNPSNESPSNSESDSTTEELSETKSDFDFLNEKFADIQLFRYQVPEFEQLDLQKKQYIYHLAQASLAGRDIIWDQHYKHNLTIRRTIEQIIAHYTGDREEESFKQFMTYAKRVWVANGIHHHYSLDKFKPEFTEQDFRQFVNQSPNAKFPTHQNESLDQLVDRLAPILFNPEIDKKRMVQDSNVDMIAASANNLYENVTQSEVEKFYELLKDPDDSTPISYGLNSKLIKKDDEIIEKTYKANGMYGQAISKIIGHLNEAKKLSENDAQKVALEKLVKFYQSGDLNDFDEFNKSWVKDTSSRVDLINGFIETYDDPLGMRGNWESVVFFKDIQTSKTFGKLAKEAAWFEKNAPIAQEHKRENPTGVSYRVVNVAIESGDSSPTTPIGINLPNSNWIRSNHGSKSVSLGNIIDAYNAAGGKSTDEFYLPHYAKLVKKYGILSSKLQTGLHEVIGHASGKLEPDVRPPRETLKNYASPLEEARADLFGLYFVGDPKLVQLGLSPSTEIIKAAYISYITNGLFVQLKRIEPGRDVEEAHMRNRQMIAKWAFEKGKDDNVIEQKKIEGKTYFVINDYQKLHQLFGQLLKEIQRIKSQGDYQAGKDLIENYGVKVDPELHQEVLKRAEKLNEAPYGAFINPNYELIKDEDNKVLDVKVSYPTDFTKQMLDYAQNHSFLPNYN